MGIRMYAGLCCTLLLALGCAGPSGPQGPMGTDGINGQDPDYTPTIAITPCGPTSAQYKETLLGLFGGGLFSEFSGSAISNILLPDGSYSDTDTSGCNFVVATDVYGNRLISWNGSSTSGNTYHAGQAYYNAAAKSWTASY